MTTWQEAKTPKTVAQLLAAFLAALDAAGGKTAGYSEGAPQRVLGVDFARNAASETEIRAEMASLIDVNELALDTTDESWVDAFGGWFDEERIPALPAVWDVPMTSSALPVTLGPTSTVQVQTTAGVIFELTQTAPQALPHAVRFTARAAGVGGNVSAGALQAAKIITGPAGLSINGTPTLVTAGRDREKNSAYMRRCLGKWSRLGAGWTEEAIAYLVQQASPSITRMKIYTDSPRGPGTTLVIAANAAGAATGPEIAAALALLMSRSIRPCGSGPAYVEAATEQPVSLTATLDENGTNATILTDAETAILAFFNAFPIGVATVDDSIVRGVLTGGGFTSIAIDTDIGVVTITPSLPGFTGAVGLSALSYGAPLDVALDSVLVPSAVIS